MKKFTKVLAVVLAIALCAGLFVACGEKATDGNGTIAVVAKGETHAFWQAVKAGAEEGAWKVRSSICFVSLVGHHRSLVL